MGQAAPNTGPISHVEGGVFKGYSCIVHQGNIGLYTQAPDIPWSQFRTILIAARNGTDAELDAVASATVAWGTWWTAEVVATGMRPAVRLALRNHIPPHLPIP